MMDLRHGKTRTNVEVDRLSILPDDLIHKILSFNSSKDAVETSVLSSRWWFIWTSIPHLHFSTYNFPDFPKFCEFVTHFLSHRNNQTDVSSVNIRFDEKFSLVILKKILKYAFSHNVQQLTISCWGEKKIKFPLSLFNSQSLKHLTLTGFDYVHLHMLESTWDLQALTTLHLDYVTFIDHDKDTCINLFSKCTNLKNLTLSDCTVEGTDVFGIFHPGLLNLKLDYAHTDSIVFKVVAPQLMNLTITNWSGKYFVSAPNLFLPSSLMVMACCRFSEEGFHSLEKVDLCICDLYKQPKEDLCNITNLLQQLHSVKFLTLNTELVEFLSSRVELISDQISPFTNMKSLKIYPNDLSKTWDVKEALFTEVVNYLLNSSTNASFTLVSREEVRAVFKTKLVQNLMAELRVQLDEEKTNSETQKAKMHEQEKTQVYKMEIDMWGSMVNGCWEDLRVRIEQGKIKTRGIVSKLQRILEKLYEIPAPKREKIEACFSNLCVEANIVMNQMMDCVKIKCDEHQISSSVGFSTTSQPFS